MKKILLIGPIADFGGRELEAGFIAKSLTEKFEVSICTTGNLTAKSQVFDFGFNFQVYSVNDLVYNDNLYIRIFSFFSWIKNNCKLPITFYVKSKINKFFFNVEKQVINQIRKQVQKSDTVFICAQLTTNYIETIINYANQFQKPVFFRTTGAIGVLEKNKLEYLKKVTRFIHHSEANAFNLNSQLYLPYVIIDQCSFNEKSLLEIDQLDKKVATFITIARLVKEKNVAVVIEAFLKIKNDNDRLYVVGDGVELEALKALAFGESSVIFTGFVSNSELKDYFEISDCIIISSEGETGPLTGIEAMAAGKIIISVPVGAMPERLPKNELWFDNSVADLVMVMNKVKEMEKNEVAAISEYNRKRYVENYSEFVIREAYIDLVNSFLVKNNNKN